MIEQIRIKGPTNWATLYVDPDDHITHWLRHGSYYEGDLLQVIRELSLRGTYIDVGAHIGNHTLFFGIECNAEHMIAIEPNQSSYVQLCANIIDNRLIQRSLCINAVVHPVWESAHFSGTRQINNSGTSIFQEGGEISVVRLDDLRLAHDPPIVLVKVDVEGSSLAVLSSALSILRSEKPVLALEAIGDELDRQRDWLSEFGYELHSGPYCATPVYIWMAK